MMDIADATIVSGVLSRLFAAGWVLVATCNRTPDEFGRSILHREHPQARFTQHVAERCRTVHLEQPLDARTGEPLDYRRTLSPSEERTYLSPHGHPSVDAHLESLFESSTAGRAVRTEAVVGAGRSIGLLACPRGVARLRFSDLCDVPLGATDYIALAQQYHTIFVTGLPQLSLKSRDQARRFITLVDQLYNHRTKLVATAAVPLARLFEGAGGEELISADLEGLEFEGEAGKAAALNPIGVTANSLAASAAGADTAAVSADSRKALVRDSLFTGEDERFAFRRALSRLGEMQSVEYLARGGARRVAELARPGEG